MTTKIRYTKNNNAWLGSMLVLFITVILACTLINSNAWPNSTMAAFYLSTISAGLFIIVCSAFFVFRKIQWSVALSSPPTLFIISWSLYVLLHGLFTGGVLSAHIYIITCCVLFVCCSALFQAKPFRAHAISRVILLLAVIEAMVCFFQLAGMIAPMNRSFTVTGTWVNPNVTAMFLAMALPAAGYLWEMEDKKGRIITLAATGLILTALILLQCRTAIIGALVVLVITGSRFLPKTLWTGKRRQFKITVLLIALLALAAGGWSLYQFKKSSSDGRIFIWKISTQMIGQKPLQGFGYGMFDRSYNLAQAGYFASGSASEKEKENASYIRMGYNEYLQNLVEGGVAGLLLFAGLIVSLLLKPPFFNAGKTNLQDIALNTAAYAGIAAFAVMSLFNFSIQAIPVMLLFILYGAIRQALLCPAEQSGGGKKIAGKLPVVTGISLLIIGLFIVSKQLRESNAQVITRQAMELVKEKHLYEAARLLYPLESKLNASQGYWMTCAEMQLKKLDYEKAAYSAYRAKQVTANPEVYLMSALCNYRLGKYTESEKDLEQASFINPALLEPHYRLMNIYAQTKDTVKANRQAQYIISAVPKTTSQKTDFYKLKAKELLAGKKITDQDVTDIN